MTFVIFMLAALLVAAFLTWVFRVVYVCIERSLTCGDWLALVLMAVLFLTEAVLFFAAMVRAL